MREPARSPRARKDRGAEPPKTPAQLASFVPYLLNRLINRWNLDQSRDLIPHEINNTTLRALSVLYIYETLTVNEIAAFAVAEQSNASRTIDTMVSEGLVERQIAKTDLRRREIALTAKGEALLKRLWPIMDRNYATLTAGIAPEDIEACVRVLTKMIDNVGEGPV